MNRTAMNEQALKKASNNFQNAFDARYAAKFLSIPTEEKVAWAMATMIHCDMCRLVVAFDECDREGLARLLWMADISSKLHEVKRWYLEKGGKLLLKIAKNKSCGDKVIREKIKEMRTKYPIIKVDAYVVYRNKIGYHYDEDALDYLEKFGKEDADAFFDMLSTFAQFSGEWAQLTSSLIKNQL
jgi:uncharacterized protein YpbB